MSWSFVTNRISAAESNEQLFNSVEFSFANEVVFWLTGTAMSSPVRVVPTGTEVDVAAGRACEKGQKQPLKQAPSAKKRQAMLPKS